ncbi:MAG: response regulator [Thermodesulfobacteriota bacterium]
MITKDSKNVLVADDSLFFRVRLSDILAGAGHNVRLAENGKEVINEINANSDWIDLLSLDLQMPHIDGFGVLEWLNENGYKGKFPVLVVTGLYEPGHVIERLKRLGATGLMTKAFTPEHTIFRFNQLLFPEKWAQGSPRKRVPVSIPVDFTIDGFTRTGLLLNLSDTGAFLHTDVAYPVGTPVQMQFSLSGLPRILDITGTVRWLTQEKTGKTFFCGYGITFGSISEEDRVTLAGFVDAETKRLGL